MKVSRVPWPLFVGLLGLLVGGRPVGAQVEERPDSTRLRLLDRLRVLGLPPGDSSMALPDSILRAREMEARQAAAVEPGGGQDLFARLRALRGYSASEYEGRSAEYRAAAGVLYLYGDSSRPAVLRRDGERLQADSVIRYDETARVVDARGRPVYMPAQGDEVRSEGLRVSLDREEAAAVGARTRFDEGATWIVTGDLPLIQSELAYGHKTRFTSCELDEPHYHFETDELKIVRGRILVARPVRLYFGDVPVAWLPFIAQSLASGRASGLLTPRFSVNDIVRTSGGYRRRVSNLGYYWAMSEYSDALLAVDWFDDNYTALNANVQYRWLRRFLDGSLALRRYWRAEGGTELTLSTRHAWEVSERTSFRMSANYASSSNFVSQNSFNPQELTRSINSQGGLNQRFDWGNLSVSANRRQYLTDDRVEMTLPDLSLSLKTVTLFPAPAATASPFNNITWSGGGSVRRASRSFAPDAGRFDDGTLDGRVNSSLSLGRLSIGGNLSYREASTLGVPRDSLPFFPGQVAERGMRAFQTIEGRVAAQEAETGERVDIAQSTLDWSSSVSFQQNLVGSTTLTPRVTFSGSAMRADTSRYAQNFLSAPGRVAFGAALKSDIYGFFPGFGGFERVRHKLSPSFTYDWSPEVEPNEVQVEVFGARTLQPNSVLTLSLNQTFEAKRRMQGDTAAAATTDSVAGDGLRRLETGQVVNLLSLNTSAISYDFVEADSSGFLAGFRTTRLTNTISSDYLRGMQVSMAHDLFDDAPGDPGEGGQPERRFAPHLSQLNFGFTLNSRSSLVRWLGIGGGGGPAAAQPRGALPEEGGLGSEEDLEGVSDEASIIPGGSRRAAPRGPGGGPAGAWSANLSYSLTRPRSGENVNEMVQARFTLQPTEKWQMTWRTGYDLQRSQFTDHIIRLTRDLHRWQANFDFLQTATGNWSFRFEVTLLDNEDLRFDYQQRNVDGRIGGAPGRVR
jgi:hypothetical protein